MPGLILQYLATLEHYVIATVSRCQVLLKKMVDAFATSVGVAMT